MESTWILFFVLHYGDLASNVRRARRNIVVLSSTASQNRRLAAQVASMFRRDVAELASNGRRSGIKLESNEVPEEVTEIMFVSTKHVYARVGAKCAFFRPPGARPRVNIYTCWAKQHVLGGKEKHNCRSLGLALFETRLACCLEGLCLERWWWRRAPSTRYDETKSHVRNVCSQACCGPEVVHP